MIKTIAFHILKGGVGKTTISSNIGYAISKHNKKTILVDCDIQASLSSIFIKDDVNYEYELSDILMGRTELKKAIIEIRDNLFILPNKKKDSDLKNYAEIKLIQEPYIFEDLNAEIEKLDFEYVIYDLAPSISQLERCILLACNEVITPITAEYLSINGLDLFYNELQKINKSYRKNIKYDKIILNMVNNSFDTHKQYTELLSNFNKYKVYKIGQDRKIADSQKYNQTIYKYKQKSNSILELEKITTDLINV
jgi:cellulose biosynthesis protein BcsQ